MPGRNGSAVMPQQTLNTIFEKLGNVEAVAREAKHAANGATSESRCGGWQSRRI
jgi:hypothetical protein